MRFHSHTRAMYKNDRPTNTPAVWDGGRCNRESSCDSAQAEWLVGALLKEHQFLWSSWLQKIYSLPSKNVGGISLGSDLGKRKNRWEDDGVGGVIASGAGGKLPYRIFCSVFSINFRLSLRFTVLIVWYQCSGNDKEKENICAGSRASRNQLFG